MSNDSLQIIREVLVEVAWIYLLADHECHVHEDEDEDAGEDGDDGDPGVEGHLDPEGGDDPAPLMPVGGLEP